MQVGPVISLSPSFNSYSNPKLAGVAARVIGEFDSDEVLRENSTHQRADQGGGISNNRNPESDAADGEDDFDFTFETKESESSSQIPADQIFQNGKIRPVYPVSNRDLLLGHVKVRNENKNGNDDPNLDSERPKIRPPLRKLLIAERETTSSSSSSSETGEVDGAAAESYCLWRTTAAEGGRGKKSSSAAGSSKRWKFKDLLRRSHSHGSKNNIVFLSHSNSSRKKEDEKKVNERPVGSGKVNPAPPPPNNRYGGEKRRSYLPYRQDLVGFFGNVNGLRKNLKHH